MSEYDIDPELRQTVEDELYSGETLLWAGKSKPGSALRGQFSSGGSAMVISVMIGLAVMFLTGMVFVMRADTSTTVSSSGDAGFSVFMPLMVIILGLIGFVMVSLKRSRIGRAFYALTDQRALIISQRLTGGRSIKSYGEADIDRIERRMHRDGSGDIIFAHETRSGAYYGGPGVYGRRNFTTEIGFFGIPDARQVEMLMLETFKLRDGGGKYKYKQDELADDGDIIFEDDYENGNKSTR